MLILTIRTDKPEAELGLYQDNKSLAYQTWQAHRQLAETIHQKLSQLLKAQTLDLKEVEGLVVFGGPGSFTGLRIGASVANALAYSLKIPIVATEGEGWIKQGTTQLLDGKDEVIGMPNYGAEPKTTSQKK